jgi:hypothetical protein
MTVVENILIILVTLAAGRQKIGQNFALNSKTGRNLHSCKCRVSAGLLWCTWQGSNLRHPD